MWLSVPPGVARDRMSPCRASHQTVKCFPEASTRGSSDEPTGGRLEEPSGMGRAGPDENKSVPYTSTRTSTSAPAMRAALRRSRRPTRRLGGCGDGAVIARTLRVGPTAVLLLVIIDRQGPTRKGKPALTVFNSRRAEPFRLFRRG